MRLPQPGAWAKLGARTDVFGHGVFTVAALRPGFPTIALLHGYPSSSHDYALVLDALGEHYGVIVHDHLGFGLSAKPADASYALAEQAEVALEVWRQHGVARVHLIAHDYGASVATELLARRERGGIPVEIETLTLTNGSVHLDLARPRPIQWLLRHPLSGPIVARLAGVATFRRNMRAVFGDPGVVDPDDLDAMWHLLIRDGGRAVLPIVSRYLDERVRLRTRWIGSLTRLDRPAHVLWGDADPVARSVVAEALAAEIPDSQLTWMPGVGHYPMIEAPGPWAAAVLAFLGAPDPRR